MQNLGTELGRMIRRVACGEVPTATKRVQVALDVARVVAVTRSGTVHTFDLARGTYEATVSGEQESFARVDWVPALRVGEAFEVRDARGAFVRRTTSVASITLATPVGEVHVNALAGMAL